MTDWQHAENKRAEVDKFFERPFLWDDVLGYEVSFLHITETNVYVREGRVYDYEKGEREHQVTRYSIISKSGLRYSGIPRHHIRDLPEISDSI